MLLKSPGKKFLNILSVKIGGNPVLYLLGFQKVRLATGSLMLQRIQPGKKRNSSVGMFQFEGDKRGKEV